MVEPNLLPWLRSVLRRVVGMVVDDRPHHGDRRRHGLSAPDEDLCHVVPMLRRSGAPALGQERHLLLGIKPLLVGFPVVSPAVRAGQGRALSGLAVRVASVGVPRHTVGWNPTRDRGSRRRVLGKARTPARMLVVEDRGRTQVWPHRPAVSKELDHEPATKCCDVGGYEYLRCEGVCSSGGRRPSRGLRVTVLLAARHSAHPEAGYFCFPGRSSGAHP